MIDLDSDLDLLEEYWAGVGSRLEQARKAKGFEKRKEVAELCDVTVGRLANFEAGTRRLSYVQIEKFAELYGVNPAWLAGYDKNFSIKLTHLKDEATGKLGEVGFTKSWFERHQYTESNVSTLVVEDKSMAPVIKPNECILINKTFDISTKKDLFAIKVHGKVWVRWIEKVKGNSYSVTSENEDSFFSDQVYSAEKFDQIEVLGRVDMVLSKR